MSSLTLFPVARGFICAAWILLACASAGTALSQDQSSPPTTTSETARDQEIDADFRGFVIPDHTRFDHSFSLTAGTVASINHDDTRHAPYSISNGAAGAEFGWLRDSDRVRVGAGLQLNGSGSRSKLRIRNESSQPELAPGESRRDIETSEAVRLDLDCYYFPWQGRSWGGRIRALGRMEDAQRWRSRREVVPIFNLTNEWMGRSEDWAYSSALIADLVVGYGRVRDATGVFQVRLLEERLTRDGRLAHPLSSNARRSLAQLFYARPIYSSVHGLEGKAFWRDVERILVEDGAIDASRFDAYDLLHATEGIVVAGSRFTRSVGFFAGPVLTVDHGHQATRSVDWSRTREWRNDQLIRESSNRQAQRTWTGDDALLAGFEGQWHRPLGRRFQIDLSTNIVSDLEGLNVDRRWDSQLGAAYLIGERWFASVDFFHQRRIALRDAQVSTWNATLESALHYYLEDRWSLNLSCDNNHTREFGREAVAYRRSTQLSLGLVYETGRADVPGIASPIRPLH